MAHGMPRYKSGGLGWDREPRPRPATAADRPSVTEPVRGVIYHRVDRPSVTDDARAEAERHYPALNADDEALTYPRSAVREHARGGFVKGYEAGWAAGRAETTTEVTGSTSDGYHTFDELYEYRMLYNAHAAHGWYAAGIPVVKSWHHSDGELCFGGGWFIVVATLPTGQVSNHYKAEHWDLFQVPAVDLPPKYDGHTPAVAAERLRAALAAPTDTTKET